MFTSVWQFFPLLSRDHFTRIMIRRKYSHSLISVQKYFPDKCLIKTKAWPTNILKESCPLLEYMQLPVWHKNCLMVIFNILKFFRTKDNHTYTKWLNIQNMLVFTRLSFSMSFSPFTHWFYPISHPFPTSKNLSLSPLEIKNYHQQNHLHLQLFFWLVSLPSCFNWNLEVPWEHNLPLIFLSYSVLYSLCGGGQGEYTRESWNSLSYIEREGIKDHLGNVKGTQELTYRGSQWPKMVNWGHH